MECQVIPSPALTQTILDHPCLHFKMEKNFIKSDDDESESEKQVKNDEEEEDEPLDLDEIMQDL